MADEFAMDFNARAERMRRLGQKDKLKKKDKGMWEKLKATFGGPSFEERVSKAASRLKGED